MGRSGPVPQIVVARPHLLSPQCPILWRVTDPYPYTYCVENIKCRHQNIGCSSQLPSSINYSCLNKWENLHGLLWFSPFLITKHYCMAKMAHESLFFPNIELSIKLTQNIIWSDDYTVSSWGEDGGVLVIGFNLSVRLSVRLHTETIQICVMVSVKLRCGREYIDRRINLNEYESRSKF